VERWLLCTGSHGASIDRGEQDLLRPRLDYRRRTCYEGDSITMKKFKVLSCFSLLMGLLNSTAVILGATYYVAKSGKDSNPCTQVAPCLTITQGLSKAIIPGDLLLVKAGTYSETVLGWKSGTAGKPITVKANPGDTVVWRGGSKVLSSDTGAILIDNQSYIRIEGFTFDGTVNGATIRIRGPVDAKDSSPNVVGIEIVNNVFTNNGNDGTLAGTQSRMIYLQGIGKGSTYSGPTLNTISENRFEDNYGSDIWMIQSSDTLIADNVSVNLKSSQAGTENGNTFMARSIHLGGGSHRNVIERNDISSMSEDGYVTTSYNAAGLRLDAGSSYNILQDNVIHDLDFTTGDVSSSGIFGESGCNYDTYQRNIIYNIGGEGMRDGSLNTNPPLGSRFLNNTVYNCKNSGLTLTNNKNSTVKNNLFINNGQAQVYVSSKSLTNGGHVFRNNDYFKVGKTQIANWNGTNAVSPPANKTLSEWAQLSGETGALSADPLFINPPTDFHLRTNSPANGTGESGVDMGAYQGPGTISSVPSVPTGLRIVN